MSVVQAILFDINKFDTDKARKWLRDHGYRPIKRVHKTARFLRYRIRKPKKNGSYITKHITPHIRLIIEMR